MANGAFVGAVREFGTDLALQRGKEQAVISVQRRRLDKVHGTGTGHHHVAIDPLHGQIVVKNNGDLQQLLFFTAVDRQDLVALQVGKDLAEIIVEPIDRVLLRRRSRDKLSLAVQQFAQLLAQVGVVTDGLGNDVAGTGQGLFRTGNALFRIHIVSRGYHRFRAVPPLLKQKLGQRSQSLFPGHGGSGTALLLIGAIEILQLGQSHGLLNARAQLVGEFPLFLDGGKHAFPAFIQAPQILESCLQRAQRGIVHGAVQFLAVTGDKRDGVALIQQPDHVFNVFRFLIQFLR